MTGFLPPSSKCTRFSVAAPWRMMCEPVVVSPTKATALMAGCSVSALARALAEAVHEIDDAGGAAVAADFGVHDLGRGSPRESGLHSAGLCTTVQPAASAGAIFQVESMNGVFHGVMTPTGPIGWRSE